MIRKIDYHWETGVSSLTGYSRKSLNSLSNYTVEHKDNRKTIIYYDTRFIEEDEAAKIVRVEAKIKLHSLITTLKIAPTNGKDMSYVWKDYEDAYNLINFENFIHCQTEYLRKYYVFLFS